MNQIKNRLLFLSPTVQISAEKESSLKDFEVKNHLGSGAFGKVSYIIHKATKKEFAMKQIEKNLIRSSGMAPQLANEVKIMYSLYHQNIVKIYNHFEDDNYVYLLLEYAKGGQLYHKLMKQPNKRFDEKTVILIIRDLLNALDYIHQKGIIHRDIKPENILIDDKGVCKLADFGWSNFENVKKKRETYCGTLDYLAPEMVDEKHKHDKSVDIWSVGVLICELLTGKAPFSPSDDRLDPRVIEDMTKKNIADVKIDFPVGFPPLAKMLVKQILVKDPLKRLSIQQIKDDQWLKPTGGSNKLPTNQEASTSDFKVIIENYLKTNKEAEEQAKILNKVQNVWTIEEAIGFAHFENLLNGDFIQKTETKAGNAAKMQDIYAKKDPSNQLQKEYDYVSGELKHMDAEAKTLKKEIVASELMSSEQKLNAKEIEQLKTKLNLIEEEKKLLRQQNERVDIEKLELKIRCDNLIKHNQGILNNANIKENQLVSNNLQVMENLCRSMEKQLAEYKVNSENYIQNKEYLKKIEIENQQLRAKVLELQSKLN